MTTEQLAKAVIIHLTGRPEEPTLMLLKMLEDAQAEHIAALAKVETARRDALELAAEFCAQMELQEQRAAEISGKYVAWEEACIACRDEIRAYANTLILASTEKQG